MSAWSDWHSGAITDDEYRLAYAFDCGEDHGEKFDSEEDNEHFDKERETNETM